MDDILVEEYRGEVLENVHRGHICIVDASGEVKYFVGNPEHITYMRSAAKPLQAVPVIYNEFDRKFGFNDREAAIMAASHRGESFHIEILEALMKKLGIEEECLVCLPAYPLNITAREALISANFPKRRIYHNCSGKHFGIITLCRGLGYSVENYWDINHPAQQIILDFVSVISGYARQEIKIGIDGCGVPVFAMPIKNLAGSFLRMACPDLIDDVPVAEAVKRVTRLMNNNYEIISGTNAICSTLLKDKNIVAKGGAKGVYCFGLKDERMGVALKIMDGSEEEWPIIIASILEQINYSNKETIDELYKLAQVEIKNDNNKVVGFSRAAFKLS